MLFMRACGQQDHGAHAGEVGVPEPPTEGHQRRGERLLPEPLVSDAADSTPSPHDATAMPAISIGEEAWIA